MNVKNIFSTIIGRGWLWGSTKASQEAKPLKALEHKDDLQLVSIKLLPEAVLDLEKFQLFLFKHLFSSIPYTNYRVKIFSNHTNLSKHQQCIEGELRSIDKLSFENGSKYPILRLNILIKGTPAQVPYFIGPQSKLPDSLSIKQIKRIELVDQQYSIFFPEDKEYSDLNLNTAANREAAYRYQNNLDLN